MEKLETVDFGIFMRYYFSAFKTVKGAIIALANYFVIGILLVLFSVPFYNIIVQIFPDKGIYKYLAYLIFGFLLIPFTYLISFLIAVIHNLFVEDKKGLPKF